MTDPTRAPTLASPILPAGPDASFASLRRRPIPREERYALGRSLRRTVPRSELARWSPARDRRDPVEQVGEANEGRLQELVPVRVARMVASPFAFLRGAAGIMAEDFAGLAATGITPVICGDAHLSNFGFYASPERQLVFDLNDFDEAHPGPWEWDVRRLVASIWVAGRQNGCGEADCQDSVGACVSAYRRQLAQLAEEPLLARSYERLDVDSLRSRATDAGLRSHIDAAAARARRKTSDRALPRMTTERDGVRHIVEEPPLLTRLPPAEVEPLAAALDEYLTTLRPHWARVVGGYTLIDVAHKVVGVGSVGLRAYIALCEGSSPDDVLFLQIKEARRSVVARFVHGESAWHAHQGQRVVEYQQALQTVSDPLLGWLSVRSGPDESAERQFYVRQFRDMKGAILVDGIEPAALADYAGICGYLLAKGHARTSGASMIAGYLGKGDKADDALSVFARAYADQTERDHAALRAAVAQGRLPCEHGI